MARRVWAAAWRITVFLVIWGTISAAFIVPLSGGAGALAGPRLQLYFDVAALVAVAAAAWIATRFSDRRPFRSLGFNARAAFPELLLGAGVALGMASGAIAILSAAGWMTIEAGPSAIGAPLALVLASIAANAVAQEILFQGYVLQTIAARFSTTAAVSATAILFTAAHAGAFSAGSVLPPLNLLLAGILLAVSYTTTRNLWLPIALHFGWNALQGPVLGLPVSGQQIHAGATLMRSTLTGPPMITGGMFGLEGGVVGTVMTAAAIAAVLGIATARRSVRPAGPTSSSGRA